MNFLAMMESLILRFHPPPVTMCDIVRVRKLDTIYLLRTLTNTPSTENNQMVRQPPASELIDIFPIMAQLDVTWRWI